MEHTSFDLDLAFDKAVDTVTGALADEGFGVITRIDMDQTVREKLGEEMPRYTILGACNPRLALDAVRAAPEVGLVLPCNVTVEAHGDGTRVRIPDAHDLLGGAGLEDTTALAELADDAAARLDRVAAALKG